MTSEQLHILQHALGVDKYGLGEMYRNHYVGGVEDCRPLVALGYMEECKPRAISGGDPWFYVTKEGKIAVSLESPKPPKITRSQRRMIDYRDFADAFDCSFKDFLKIEKTDWYKNMKAGISPASVLGDYL
jgi:hypothetical protein